MWGKQALSVLSLQVFFWGVVNLVIFYFLFVLHLQWCLQAFSSCGKGRALLLAVASH